MREDPAPAAEPGGAEPLWGNVPSYFPFPLTDRNLIPQFTAF